MNVSKLHISVDMDGRPELLDGLDKYRRSKGITWRRFVVLGMAAYISEQKDGDNLVLDIINYLEGVR